MVLLFWIVLLKLVLVVLILLLVLGGVPLFCAIPSPCSSPPRHGVERSPAVSRKCAGMVPCIPYGSRAGSFFWCVAFIGSNTSHQPIRSINLWVVVRTVTSKKKKKKPSDPRSVIVGTAITVVATASVAATTTIILTGTLPISYVGRSQWSSVNEIWHDWWIRRCKKYKISLKSEGKT